MLKMSWPCFGMLAALLVAGCTNDDPKEGGLLGGLVGLGSGSYDKRIDDETATLQAETVRYQQQIESNEQLDQSLREGREHASDLQLEVVSLEVEMDGLDAEIVTLQDEESLTEEVVEKAKADVASLRHRIDRIEAEQKAHEEAKALGADADPETDPAAFGEPPRDQVTDLRAYINKLQAAVDALKHTREQRSKETKLDRAETDQIEVAE
ncbi:MAG: hypothetical protein ACR2QJ_14835 [Geminicoccaceae bacterium]